MKPANQILAEQLQIALLEGCCGKCGALGKKSCCSAPKTEPKKPVSEEKKEKHTHPFIKRCVAAMTAKGGTRDPHEPDQLSSAFAVCTASKKAHPKAAKEKAKEGVSEKRMGQFEKALAVARKARKASK